MIAVETSGHLPEALDLNRSLAVGVLSRQKRFSRSNKREKKSLETQMLVKKIVQGSIKMLFSFISSTD